MTIRTCIFVIPACMALLGCAPAGSLSGAETLSSNASIQDTSLAAPGGQISFKNIIVSLSGRRSYGIYVAESSNLYGTVINNTDRTMSSIAFDLIALDAQGNPIGSSEIFITQPLSPGAQMSLTNESVLGLNQDTEGRKVSRIQIDDLEAWFPVVYDFKMLSPQENGTPTYEDDNLEIVFAISREGIGFALHNKSGEPIRLNWDDVSYVDPTGSSHRVIHSGVKYSERSNAQAPTTVPPGARIEDSLHPADMIRYSEIMNEWVEEPLFPGRSAALEMAGEQFSLFMPLTIGREINNYDFRFEVEGVGYE